MKTAHAIAFFVVIIVATALVSAEEDPINDVTDDVTLDRKKATDFKKDRRWFWPKVDEECYHECCSREEVAEHFSSSNGDDYWEKYQKWRKTPSSHC